MKEIVLRKLNNEEVKTLVEQEVIVQQMEQTKWAFTDGDAIKGVQLINKAKLLKQNMRFVDPASSDYAVIKAKHKEIMTYVQALRTLTINDDEWRNEVVASRADLDELVDKTVNYDIEKENEKLLIEIDEMERALRR